MRRYPSCTNTSSKRRQLPPEPGRNCRLISRSPPIGQRIVAWKALYNVKYSADEPITSYIQAVPDARPKFQASSCIIADTEFIDVLMNLDESFRAIRTTILALKQESNLVSITDMLVGPQKRHHVRENRDPQ